VLIVRFLILGTFVVAEELPEDAFSQGNVAFSDSGDFEGLGNRDPHHQTFSIGYFWLKDCTHYFVS